ncbi:MAG: 50S ribosomal protein L4 [Pirellulaceae bacterium]|nr:MAG: 50S ribosomal protein L4 [Pirellulaceae bacterium]GIW94641.1 MAG: 50S ribosomal protein L4 [Pirellulaceae bacterium]
MIQLPVFDVAGQQVGQYEIDLAVLAPRINKQLLHDVVVMYQANQRLGTFRTKSRGEVAGSTRKLYRQKGTGRARVGTRRTGKRVGGGHTFAKRPRDFSYRLPRKALLMATRMALAGKIRDQQVVVLQEFVLAEPKTRQVAGVLKALNVAGQTTLIVPAEHDPLLWRCARNIEGVSVQPAAQVNALSLLLPRRVVFTRAGLDALLGRLLPAAAAAAS